MKKIRTVLQAGFDLEHSYTRLPDKFYSSLQPTPVRDPKLNIMNDRLATALGLDAGALRSEDGVAILAGNALPEGAEPLAQAYAGHQFGHLTMLGDGRALLLGEHMTPNGERVDIQFKGSGRTPYSRGGDGRAAIGPMLREYIISEAMHALGVPTTRSLAVVTTGEPVYREDELQGAILTRIASSHIRVGTFQYAAGLGDPDKLRALADYTLDRHFPKYVSADNRYVYLLQQISDRQAELIAKWQLVGFIHGVMNTDNMAISGETIDYGPCAFMDAYDPATVFSSIDRQGRYAYGQQPNIAAWNLARLAETLLPLLHEDEDQAVRMAEDMIAAFAQQVHHNWLAGMRAKLGLFNTELNDEDLIQDLLRMMQKHRADFTNTFLTFVTEKTENLRMTGGAEGFESLPNSGIESLPMAGTEEFTQWVKRWTARLGRQQQSEAESRELMQNNNPVVIPRNQRVEEALAAAEQGDNSVMLDLLDALSHPYDHTREQEQCYITPDSPDQPYRTFCGT